MNTKKTKNQYDQSLKDNSIEAPKSVGGGGIVKSMAYDFMQQTSQMKDDFWNQIFATNEYKTEPAHQAKHGDLIPGQEISLKASAHNSVKEERSRFADSEPGIDYRREIVHGEQRVSRQKQQETERKIQELLTEIKRLIASSTIIQAEFKEVSVDQYIETPGAYHVAFFEWVITVIKTARMRVEDAGAWLAVCKSKKAKRGYWEMFKKHGTSFGLNNERVVATQTG